MSDSVLHLRLMSGGRTKREESRDYYVTLRVQSGRMKAAMVQMGIRTAKELSDRSGVAKETVGQLLNFRMDPRKKRTGEWRDVTLRICRVLGMEPEHMFPSHLQYEVLTNRIEAYAEQAQLMGLENAWCPRELSVVEERDRRRTISDVLATIPPRHRRCIEGRFLEGKTLVQVGAELGVSRGRAQQIEEMALRMLRHPWRSERLARVCNFDVYDGATA